MIKKTIFPNYLNSPRIILYWETDEIKFILSIIIFIFALLFVLNAPTYVIVIVLALIVPASYEGYKRLTKESAPNWFNHFLYEQGISNGVSKRFLVQNGFDKEANILPPSFITVFEG